MIEIARNKVSKNNGQVFCKDIFVDDEVGSFDFAIINGIFNHKCSGDQEANDNLKKVLVKVFEHCNMGMVFNFCSTYVNWHDEDFNYYNPFEVAQFVTEHLSRKFRMDHHYYKTDVCMMVLR